MFFIRAMVHIFSFGERHVVHPIEYNTGSNNYCIFQTFGCICALYIIQIMNGYGCDGAYIFMR